MRQIIIWHVGTLRLMIAFMVQLLFHRRKRLWTIRRRPQYYTSSIPKYFMCFPIIIEYTAAVSLNSRCYYSLTCLQINHIIILYLRPYNDRSEFNYESIIYIRFSYPMAIMLIYILSFTLISSIFFPLKFIHKKFAHTKPPRQPSTQAKKYEMKFNCHKWVAILPPIINLIKHFRV